MLLLPISISESRVSSVASAHAYIQYHLAICFSSCTIHVTSMEWRKGCRPLKVDLYIIGVIQIIFFHFVADLPLPFFLSLYCFLLLLLCSLFVFAFYVSLFFLLLFLSFLLFSLERSLGSLILLLKPLITKVLMCIYVFEILSNRKIISCLFDSKMVMLVFVLF